MPDVPTTQNRISTGLKIGEAKDNAAYWAISTTLKSDNKSLATVKDALGLGTATVDIAYQGLTKTKEVLDEIKAKLTAATQDGVDRNVIQTEIAELQKQLVSIASSSVFSGENWLSVDSSSSAYSANKTVVSSFARDANGGATIGTIGIDTSTLSLFDANADAAKSGIVDARAALTSGGRALAFGGTAAAGSTGNTTTAGLVVGTDTGVTATALQDTGVVATKGEGSFTGFTAAAFAGAADGIKFTFSTIAVSPTTGAQVLTPVVLDVLKANVKLLMVSIGLLALVIIRKIGLSRST
ncbi:flagellin, partial [Aureimonas sp. Leaf427]|uniref:flagellin N-terminal helical domain-containing protein n=1 Tax=Aureimonas sp. Leaf427 TaxID=1736375 RepID=UPI00191090AE